MERLYYWGGRYTDAYLRQPTLDARESACSHRPRPLIGCGLPGEVRRKWRGLSALGARTRRGYTTRYHPRFFDKTTMTAVGSVGDASDVYRSAWQLNQNSIMRFTRDTFLSAVTLKCSMFISYVKDFFIALIIQSYEVIYITFLNFYRNYSFSCNSIIDLRKSKPNQTWSFFLEKSQEDWNKKIFWWRFDLNCNSFREFRGF